MTRRKSIAKSIRDLDRTIFEAHATVETRDRIIVYSADTRRACEEGVEELLKSGSKLERIAIKEVRTVAIRVDSGTWYIVDSVS
jgi:hypothetical protein